MPNTKDSKNRCVVIHYGEIALKGSNRSYFEKKLLRNIKRALKGLDVRGFERLRGRMLVHLEDRSREEDIATALGHVFGIANFSFGVAVGKVVDEVNAAAWELLQDQNFESFKIETSRAQKEFPKTSIEINREVGAYVQERCGKRVDLSHPDVTCYIEIAGPYGLLYTEKWPGLRGLPVGVSENAVSLLSSGIDSPVASYKMLKRGVNLVYVHFHSQPFTSKASQENVEQLVKLLTCYQYRAKVYFISFIDIQKEIMAKCPAELRVLLYRRYMVRLAEKVANIEKARALVTGENVGQVASQTLSNIRVVGEVTRLPILRPLAGYDKEEIVNLAKQIGSFEISIEPYEDCCSLFVPKNPETRAHPAEMLRAEEGLDLDELLIKALREAETKIIEYNA